MHALHKVGNDESVFVSFGISRLPDEYDASQFVKFLQKCHEIVGVVVPTKSKLNLFVKNHWRKTAFYDVGQ